ncbi:MAG: class I tRNA ligase family protein [Cyclobacteriaceae bacterium]|nr:class I tRNA ligase family protein [Cyclobacteriaceae bacterium]
MAEYTKEEIKKIEEKWRKTWIEKEVYKVSNNTEKPKCYVLDMFPYPSGAGLHVGHPLGYIASDIYARFKRIKGFNVLHPMGFDAFGLPAEQYALEHGIHPAVSTATNINTFKKQLGNIGFSYDWSREVQTCDPKYYRWTQWIFLQIFDSWFNRKKQKAERISELVKIFETEGNINHPIPNPPAGRAGSKSEIRNFKSSDWKAFSEKEQQSILMEYRLAYLAYTDVNWCEALGTVLANDEVINGVSYRGGFPVVKRQMRQWSLRITEYADRLLKGLDEIDFSDSMKEIQRNWIGKSVGAELEFDLTPNPSPKERGTYSEEDSNENKIRSTSPSPVEKGPGDEVHAQDFIFTTDSNTWQTSKINARENRKNPTEAEEKIWEAIRNSALGFKFRRQHAISRFIVDFVCIEKKIVVEIDGAIHDNQKQEDLERTSILNNEGFKVIRFTNEEVLNDLSNVLQKLKSELTSPSPLERGPGDEVIRVFTTRPDTIFGVDFMVLAPEHDLVKQITTAAQKEEIEKYLKYVESRSEVDRMAEVKKITGAFTGAYAINPFNGKQIPVWISEYVLAGYGTGAIMAVPCGDERDHKFAKHFNIPITNIIGSHYNGTEANPTKEATLENSGFLNGMVMHKAIDVAIAEIEKLGIGKRQVNYKMRDAGWSRQRYWGEPFPVYFKDDVPYAMNENELPLALPETNTFKPSGNGEGPLANLPDWINFAADKKRDSNTMPTHAGAAWYFLRYMDPHNTNAFADKKALEYWNQVDVYIGGSEHAVAHLLYARLWTKVLHDLGYLNFDEPFKKLINQGKITGDSRFVYRFIHTRIGDGAEPQIFISKKLVDKWSNQNLSESDLTSIKKVIDEAFDNHNKLTNSSTKQLPISAIDIIRTAELHVDINIVNGLELDRESFKKWKPDFANAQFILEDENGEPTTDPTKGKYICGSAIEKMSKSYFNVVNPDQIISDYGADTLRMYEMFLGPLEASKPWSTQGIDGVFKFLRRFWNLFHDNTGNFRVSEAEPTREELKVLHKTLKKVEQDIENFSFNTSVSEFMICANELSSLKCNKRAVLEPLVIALSPFAPHIAEEIWSLLGHTDTVLNATFPKYDEQYLTESSHNYPISINGKVRAQMNFALDVPKEEIEKQVLASEIVLKWSEGKPPKKVIVVPGKIVNVVL